jgi:hypothetical protein
MNQQTTVISALIQDVINNPKVRSILPGIRTETLDLVSKWLDNIKSDHYVSVPDLETSSTGLVMLDNTVSLVDDWGVKLTRQQHSFIDKPVRVRASQDRIYVTNQGADTTTSASSCTILDQNLNLVGTVGKKQTTPNLNLGEYSDAQDFFFHASSKKYLITSSADNVIQVYNENGIYVQTLGDGLAGTPSLSALSFNKPVATVVGENGIYVACYSGQGAVGAGNKGFVVKLRPDFSFDSILLYDKQNGGVGRIFEGEVSNIKDMQCLIAPERLVILNSTDEIGVFNLDGPIRLERVIQIPSDIYNNSLGLSKICVVNDILYVTCAGTGEVLALDFYTGALKGKFGQLRNEAVPSPEGTLGFFNGLSGICSYGTDKLLVTETLNDRLQVFGKSLIVSPIFYAEFNTINLPLNTELVDLVVTAGVKVPNRLSIIDASTGIEYSKQNAILRGIKSFRVRFYIEPYTFSQKTRQFVFSPVTALIRGL